MNVPLSVNYLDQGRKTEEKGFERMTAQLPEIQ